MNQSKQLIITRHPSLVDYLLEIEAIVPGKYELITHVENPEILRNRDVIGVLPLRLAAIADTVTEVPLVIPNGLRGVVLSFDQIREYAGPMTTYIVTQLYS